MITRVVSGGQCGSDQAGLFAGRELKLETGGYAPLGWRTDAGPAPWLEHYGLVQHHSAAYPPRTAANVFHSDGTLIFGWPHSPGGQLTMQYAGIYRRPLHVIVWPFMLVENCTEDQMAADAGRKLRLWIAHHKIKVLNVAGNRESMRKGIATACRSFLVSELNGRSI